MKINDLTGKRFGKLTVIKRANNYIPASGKYQLAQWECLCDCGNKTIVIGSNLKRGNTTSCGCTAIKTRSINGKKNKKSNSFLVNENSVIGMDGKNNTFIFDSDDFDKVSKYYWSVNTCTGYVSANINGKSILLSRYIMNVDDESILVDHRNHILTDNTKRNLRCTSKAENCRNSKPQKNNTSGIPGVSYNKRAHRWVAYIYVNNVRKHLGTYKNKNDAIRARIGVENEYFGDFSYLNSIGGNDSGTNTSIFSLCNNKQ